MHLKVVVKPNEGGGDELTARTTHDEHSTQHPWKLIRGMIFIAVEEYMGMYRLVSIPAEGCSPFPKPPVGEVWADKDFLPPHTGPVTPPPPPPTNVGRFEKAAIAGIEEFLRVYKAG